MKDENSEKQKISADNEIDLKELFFLIWNERRLVYKTIAAFFIIGLIIALGSQKEYKTEVTLLPEIKNQAGGASNLIKQFGNIGSLVGIDFSSLGGTDAIRPDLYPDIITSTPFILNLLNTKMKIPSLDTTVSLYDYMTELKPTSLVGWIGKFTIKLPGTIIKWVRNDGSILSIKSDKDTLLIVISKEQNETIKDFIDCIGAGLDQKSGMLSLSVELPDPYLSAQVAYKMVDELTNYITEYRIGKAKNDMEFIASRCAEAEAKYIKAQRNLAQFRDANKNIILSSVQSEIERLQAEFNLAFDLYNGLAKQLEQAKIQVQNETPVFKILEPSKVPVEKSKPRRISIIIITTFIGGFFSLGVILTKHFIKLYFNE